MTPRLLLVLLVAPGCWISSAELDLRRDQDGDGVAYGLDCDDADPGTAGPRQWWGDQDGDGYGGLILQEACVAPNRYVGVGGDCDDTDPERNPATVEICNGQDDDCDALVDEGVEPPTWYYDYDGDGFGDSAFAVVSCTPLPGYSTEGGDCDDRADEVHPLAQEVCSGHDDDCDGLVDAADDSMSGLATWYPDNDGDGFGADVGAVVTCDPPADHVRSGGDCDDADPSTRPGAIDVCDDGIDQDCDGIVDNTRLPVTWFADDDGDGYGDVESPVVKGECGPLQGHVGNPFDCDDTSGDVHPGQGEVCNGVDDDCDGLVDDDDTIEGGLITLYADLDFDGLGDAEHPIEACGAGPGAVLDDTDCDDGSAAVGGPDTYYRDADSDGWGSTETTEACSVPAGHVSASGDCDDADAGTNPDGTDLCGDGIDQDCSGTADDDGGPYTWYRDADSDGWGDVLETTSGVDCAAPVGYVPTPGDCNDALADFHPGAAETCDGNDQDCDGLVDDGDPDVVGAQAWYADVDADGFGDAGADQLACSAPPGHVADDTDCDDGAAGAYPGAQETCNATDDDCDGSVDEGATPDGTWFWDDVDGDGFGGPTFRKRCVAPGPTWVTVGGDCDDDDSLRSPGTLEVCGDAVDDDCDGDAPGCALIGDVGLQTADATVLAATSGGQTGWSVAGLGDVDGDGFDDFAIGAPRGRDEAADDRTGVVLVFAGGSTGALDSSAAMAVLDGRENNAWLGWALAGPGDVDGDGAVDLLIGAPEDGVVGGDAGRAYLLSGPLLGSVVDDVAVRTYVASQDDRLGESLDGGDDIDGDGLPDVLLGAPLSEVSGTEAGAAFLLGSVAGGTIDVLTQADARFAGVSKHDLAGTAVAMVGDVDGDGAPDLLVGAPSVDTVGGKDGAAYLMLGPASGAVSLNDADSIIIGTSDSRCGLAVAGPGDVDGDGLDEVLVGAPEYDDGTDELGAAFLWYGSTGLAPTLPVAAAEAVLLGEARGDEAGASVAGVGDIDGDLRPDLAIGAPGNEAIGGDTGVAYLVLGAPSGNVPLSSADVRLIGETAPSRAGFDIAGAGDVDADGYADVLVGAPEEDTGGGAAGRAYLLLGGLP